MEIITLRAGARSKGTGPEPQRVPLAAMLGAIAVELQARALQPVAIVGAQSWRLMDVQPRFWSELAIEAAPGRSGQPFLAWWQWQHARFGWSIAPLPKAALGAEAGPAVGLREG